MEGISFKLKEEVKEFILKNQSVKIEVMRAFQVSESTVWRWLKENTPQSTDYNLLIFIWLTINESTEYKERYSHIKNIENLLTSKK